MSLDIKLSVTRSQDGKSVNLKDITGNYNATTNPGGYGSINGSVPAIAYLVFRSWDGAEISKQEVSSSIVTQLLSAAGYNYTSLGLTLGNQFNSKVFIVDYYPFITQSTASVTFTKDSKVITTTGNFTSLVLSRTEAISSLGVSYLIDRSTILPSSLSLTEAYRGNTVTLSAFYQAPKAQAKFISMYSAESCVSKKILEVFTSELPSDREIEANRLVTYLDAAQIHFDKSNFERANLLLDYVVKSCKPDCITC